MDKEARSAMVQKGNQGSQSRATIEYDLRDLSQVLLLADCCLFSWWERGCRFEAAGSRDVMNWEAVDRPIHTCTVSTYSEMVCSTIPYNIFYISY